MERLKNAMRNVTKELVSGPRFQPKTSRIRIGSAAYLTMTLDFFRSSDTHSTFPVSQHCVLPVLASHGIPRYKTHISLLRCSTSYTSNGNEYGDIVIKALLEHRYRNTDSKMISQCATGQQGCIHFMNDLNYTSKLAGSEISSHDIRNVLYA